MARDIRDGNLNPRLVPLSKTLARILRHDAGSVGLCPRPDGFFSVDHMLQLAHFRRWSMMDIEEVVKDSVNSQGHARYELLRDNGPWIRATTKISQRQDQAPASNGYPAAAPNSFQRPAAANGTSHAHGNQAPWSQAAHTDTTARATSSTACGPQATSQSDPLQGNDPWGGKRLPGSSCPSSGSRPSNPGQPQLPPHGGKAPALVRGSTGKAPPPVLGSTGKAPPPVLACKAEPKQPPPGLASSPPSAPSAPSLQNQAKPPPPLRPQERPKAPPPDLPPGVAGKRAANGSTVASTLPSAPACPPKSGKAPPPICPVQRLEPASPQANLDTPIRQGVYPVFDASSRRPSNPLTFALSDGEDTDEEACDYEQSAANEQEGHEAEEQSLQAESSNQVQERDSSACFAAADVPSPTIPVQAAAAAAAAVEEEEGEEPPAQGDSTTSAAAAAAADTSSADDTSCKRKSSLGNFWVQYSDPGNTGTWWHCETNENYFMESSPGDWEQFRCPERPTHSSAYWWCSRTDEWFYTTN